MHFLCHLYSSITAAGNTRCKFRWNLKPSPPLFTSHHHHHSTNHALPTRLAALPALAPSRLLHNIQTQARRCHSDNDVDHSQARRCQQWLQRDETCCSPSLQCTRSQDTAADEHPSTSRLHSFYHLPLLLGRSLRLRHCDDQLGVELPWHFVQASDGRTIQGAHAATERARY